MCYRLTFITEGFNLLKKLLQFMFCLIIATVSMLIYTYIYKSTQPEGVFFFNAFIIALLGGITGTIIWTIKNKDLFENFLIFLVFSMFNTLFIYFGPVTLDRSLSSFIYFDSVQYGSVSKDIFDDTYFEPYVQRRFTDGAKIGYLKCDDVNCYPTLKTKITYTILYPLGKLTNTTQDYENFKKFYNKKYNVSCPNNKNNIE